MAFDRAEVDNGAGTCGSPAFDIPIVSVDGILKYDRLWWTVRPTAPLLRCKVIFLTDGRAASASETILQMVRDHRLGILVGQQTAGTNGNTTSIVVPGRFEIRFTGMKVSSLRGESTHGRGLVPDHVVDPTLAGVRAGRDEILQAGIRLIDTGRIQE